MNELSESKTSSSTSSSPSNGVGVSRVRETPKLESANRISPQLTGRPKPISSESIANPKLKRSILPNKPRFDGEDVAYKREMRKADTNSRRYENEHDAKAKNLQKRLDESEILVKDMHLEILCLKGEIEKLKSLNVELEEEKKKLANDLLAAEINIAALDRHGQMLLMIIVARTTPTKVVSSCRPCEKVA